VIIPGFGGLIGRKKNAHFDKNTYIFSPPYKEISFNAQLLENDGLLANYISEINGISYNEALQIIENEVNNWYSELKNNNSIKLNQIGVFNLAGDDKIVFLPVTTTNYLMEAYGLTGFIHRPVVEKTSTANPVKVQLNVSGNKVQHKSARFVKRKPVKNNNHTNIWKYAAVFVLGLGLLGGTAGLLNKHQEPQITYQKATFVLQKDFPAVIIGAQHQTEKSIQNNNNIPEYFIISGAFRNKNNAERKKQELIDAGFNAGIIGQNKYKLWMVAYQGFVNETDARKKLSEIKKLQASAWLFHKKNQ
jgi:hypothetical protein